MERYIWSDADESPIYEVWVSQGASWASKSGGKPSEGDGGPEETGWGAFSWSARASTCFGPPITDSTDQCRDPTSRRKKSTKTRHWNRNSACKQRQEPPLQLSSGGCTSGRNRRVAQQDESHHQIASQIVSESLVIRTNRTTRPKAAPVIYSFYVVEQL